MSVSLKINRLMFDASQTVRDGQPICQVRCCLYLHFHVVWVLGFSQQVMNPL